MKLSSDAIQVEGAGPTPTDAGVTSTAGPALTDARVSNLTAACLRESYSIYLIKSHGLLTSNRHCRRLILLIHLNSGCIMCVAWGLLAPVGILIAMFYKVIWPNGEWFYVRAGCILWYCG